MKLYKYIVTFYSGAELCQATVESNDSIYYFLSDLQSGFEVIPDCWITPGAIQKVEVTKRS